MSIVMLSKNPLNLSLMSTVMLSKNPVNLCGRQTLRENHMVHLQHLNNITVFKQYFSDVLQQLNSRFSTVTRLASCNGVKIVTKKSAHDDCMKQQLIK